MMNRRILRLAIPSIISNITIPLLGLVDVAIVGHLGSPAYIGAIALGGLFFNIIYWNFGFLRMGTGGLTSQAYGRRDNAGMVQVLVQALGVGLIAALGLWILQYPIERIAFYFLEAGEEVERHAVTYIRIGIWGAPAVLMLYGFKGWYIGVQNARYQMYIAVTMNVLNIIFSLFFVYGLGMKVEGVALGTVSAQYLGLFLAVLLWFRKYGHLRIYIKIRESIRLSAMNRFFSVNRDIFLRTLCLISVTTFFTYAGAAQGEVVLAVNTLLMQLFTLFSYIMDGFAHAGEALAGRYFGAGNFAMLKKAIRNLFGWGGALALLFTILYLGGGEKFLKLLTNENSIIEAASAYFFWVLAIPLAGFAAFLWDGILIGLTATRYMLISMVLSVLTFFSIYYFFNGKGDNHVLWIAFLIYLFLRGGLQTLFARRFLAEERVGECGRS